MKGNHFKKFRTVFIAMLFFMISGYMLISTAIAALAQDVDVSKVKNTVDINLEKYVNYNLEEKKGTLLQLNVKTGIEYEEGTEYVPLSSTGILLNVPKINNKFPQSVEVFEKSTKATNGDEQGKNVRYNYVSETGQLIILTTNEEENGEIYKEYVEGARDNISVVLDYDESFRLDENTKNELDITGFVQTKLATQKETKVQDEINTKVEVEKEVSNLVSSDVKTSDIYNGFIKMNAKNDSNYKTTYNEEFGINISKKDLADETKIEIENSFIKNEEKTVIKDISYVSSKINKNKILDILGQEGYFKILDENGNILAEINKDTQVDQEGNYEIKYANGISKIFAIFSKPNKVGYIKINSTKEIQPSFKEVDVNKLQVVSKISSVNRVKDAQNNETEKEVYKFEDTKEIEIKNTQTVVKLAVNNAKWTNQKQNEIEFNVKLLASESSHSLFKNPIIKIQVPEEVEKVVLGDVKVTNGNGLSFKNIEYNNENRIITVTLEGEQTEYLSKNLAEGTNVIIPANVILGQEIESKNVELGVAYVNEATSEKGMFKVDVEVENFRQVQNQENEITNSVPTVVRQAQRALLRSEASNVEIADGVEIEVVPTRCTDVLNNGDAVYEGEFIKYNIKVKNTTNNDLENVKLIADLPDGVKYLREKDEFGGNIFEYVEELRQLPIEIGKIEKGQQINKDFQVRAKDLEKNETEKQIETDIKAYIGDALSDAYRFSNKIQKAEYQVALIGKSLDYNNLVYELDIDGNKENKVKVKLNLPENLEINMFQGLEENLTIEETDQNNVYNLTPGKYSIVVNPIEPFVKQENCNSLKLDSFAIVNDKYKSNELVVVYKYKNLSIEISSPTAGEKLKCNQEVTYKIKVKNITEENYNGNDLLSVALKDRLPKELNPISVAYTNYYWNDETDLLEKKEKVEELHNLDEKDENAYNLYLILQIPAQEELEFVVKAQVGLVSENTEITNVAIVEDLNEDKDENDLYINSSRIGKISSNIIKNTVLTWEESNAEDEITENIEELESSDELDEENQEEPIIGEPIIEPDYPMSEGELDEQGYIEDTTNSGEQDNQENISNNENEEETNNNEVVDTKYSITGMAWKDEDEDGQKQYDEQKLSGIEVILVDSTGKDVSKTTTDNDGQYAFNNLNSGNYIVVFKYDTNKYRLTEYQKSGVESNNNSDAIKTERNIEGKSTICGVTNSIKLNSNLENIDIGLIENKKFNFKVDKYISKVITSTSNGTDSKDYNNVKLAKTEIKSKEIENSSVKVQYKIVITNDGEVSGTVGKVVEKLPEGLKLSSDVENKTWYKNQDGSLTNTSMSGQIIEPGKKLELELIADVSNNSGVIGNYKNTVILEEISNSLGIVDNNAEDNSSSAELIVSVSTGVIIYISIIIIVIAILGLLIFLNKKYEIFKYITAVRLFVGVLLFSGVVFSYMKFLNSYGASASYFPVEHNKNGYSQKAFLSNSGIKGNYSYLDTDGVDDNYIKGIKKIKEDNYLNTNYSPVATNDFAYFIFDELCGDHRLGDAPNDWSICFTKIDNNAITFDGEGNPTNIDTEALIPYSAHNHKGRCIDPGNQANNGRREQDENGNFIGAGAMKKKLDKVEKAGADYRKASTDHIEAGKKEATAHATYDNVPEQATSTKQAKYEEWQEAVKKLNAAKDEMDNKYKDYQKANKELSDFAKKYPKIFLKYFSIKNWKTNPLFKYELIRKKVPENENAKININLDHKDLNNKEVSRTTTVKTNLKKTKDENYYLIGPLTIKNDSTDDYMQYHDKSKVKQYVFQVEYNNKTYKTNGTELIYNAYDRDGNFLGNYNIVNGQYQEFFLKIKKDDILAGNGISKVSVGITPKEKEYTYLKQVQTLRVWWPCNLTTKDDYGNLVLYQRTIEIPDDAGETYAEDWKTETITADPIILTWTVPDGIAQIQKKEKISTTKDLTGINIVLYKKGQNGGWVTMNKGVISYSTYQNTDSFKNSLVKLKTKKDGSTDPLIGLDVGKYNVYEIITCNWDSTLNIPNKFRPYYKGKIYDILPKCKLKELEVDKQVKTGVNTITETNEWDYVPLQLQKKDEIGDVDNLSGINFVFCKESTKAGEPDANGWVLQNKTTGEIYYGAWNVSKLAKLKTGEDGKTGKDHDPGKTGVLQGLEPNVKYIIYEFIDGDKNLNMPVKLRQLYKANYSIKNNNNTWNLKQIKTITLSKATSANPQVIEAKNTRDKVKLIINKIDEFKNEHIDLSGVTFLLYRQKDGKGNPAHGWAAYDSEGLITYVPWGDETKDNIKNLVKMKTKSKNKDGEYETNLIEGLDPGYYTVYEFIEGYDDYSNQFNLPEQLREYYKGNPSRTAGCSLKNVGYVDVTDKGFRQLYDAKNKYVGFVTSEDKVYDSNNTFIGNMQKDGKVYKGGKVVTFNYDPKKTVQLLGFNRHKDGTKKETKSNPRDFVAYKIHKKDPNENINLKGIKFKIYKEPVVVDGKTLEPGGWVTWKTVNGVSQIDEDPEKAVTTYDKSSTLTTNANGDTEEVQKFLTAKAYEKKVENNRTIYIGYDVTRKYKIYEVDVGDYDNHYEIGPSNGGVKMPGTNKYGKLIETWKSDDNKDGVYTRDVDNDQYYVSLSGTVWEDSLNGKDFQELNAKLDITDYKIQGIKVRLIDLDTGKTAKNPKTNKDQVATTDKDGNYKFDYVEVEKIKNGKYKIEFSYDGIIYNPYKQDNGLNESKTVGSKKVSIPAANTSKAKDTEDRTNLNNAFTELTGDGQKISYNGKDYEIKYGKGDEESYSVYSKNTCESNWERTEAKNNKYGLVKINNQGDFQVRSEIDANYLKNAYTTMKKGYKDNKKELLFTIENLNLGLYQKEKPDVTLTEDIYSVKVDINNKNYTYIYDQLGKYETTLGVAFESLLANKPYYTAIHKADIEWELNNKPETYENGELKVSVTYKIGLSNNSKSLYEKINRLKDYYCEDLVLNDKNVYSDPACTTKVEGAKIENVGNKSTEWTLLGDKTKRSYKTFDINLKDANIVVNPGVDTTQYIYVKFELPKKSFYDFKKGELYADKEFRNDVEITSYTSYSKYNAKNKTGELYAHFDTDSVPDTLTANNSNLRNFEDDSRYAPGLKLQLAHERTLSGNVFKDNIDGTIGRKNAAEKGIQNVTVQLVPTDKLTKNTENYTPEFMNVTSKLDEVKDYYNNRGLNANTLTVPTNDKGDYTISGFIPGDYQIRYIWGLNNGTIIKDGKDTKVSVGEYKSTKYTDVSNDKWYFNESANSRAIDSWQERLDFDGNLPASYNDYVTYNTDNSNKVKGNMNSWTPKLDMGVEVVGNQTKNYIDVDESGNAKYKYDIKSVNFGLIERPQQQLEVKKELTHLRIKDAQDRVIVDAEVEIKDGKKTFKNINDVLYTVLLPGSNTDPSGTIKSEIDKDYMPVTLEATYTVTVSNTSQEDYTDSNYYYYYNTDKTNPVTLKPTKVYDYISKDFDVNGSSDTNYKVETDEDYNKEINDSINKGSILYSNSSSKTIIEAAFEKWASSGFKENTLADGTKVTWENWATESRIIKSLYEEWYNTVTTKKPVRTVKLDGSKIINLQALEKESLKAGQSVSTTYTVTSLIQNKDDEIKLDNEVEIIDIDRTKNFGKTTISTYKKLYDAGESVIITPPTGEDRSKEEVNILAISLASGLAVLGIGLIFIKRRISKHNKNA